MIFLDCSYAEKDQVKSLGAKWHPVEKRWYIPDGLSADSFKQWLPDSEICHAKMTDNDAAISLSSFLKQASSALKKALPSPIWIKGEISQYQKNSKGFIAFEMVEYNSSGVLIAKTRAFIWASDAHRLLNKFIETTGGEPAAGMKVMIKVTIDLHSTSGVGVTIVDIDPTYTLGDIEANLKRIRDTLNLEGIYSKNQQRDSPFDFNRVAVISPDGAAGLGDFKRDADGLVHYGLCQFVYFTATFQGPDSTKSLLAAFNQVATANQSFDAICLIRGGGSVTDLYWLNQIDLARTICHFSIPVFTGIGHEKDNTILDEVANGRFDTPSKVIAHIRGVIYKNATEAAADFIQIMNDANRLTHSAEMTIEALLNDLKKHALDSQTKSILLIEQYWLSIIGDAQKWLLIADNHLVNHKTDIEHSIEYAFNQYSATLDRVLFDIQSTSKTVIHNTQSEINLLLDSISQTSAYHIHAIENLFQQYAETIFQVAQHHIELTVQNVHSMGREIIGLGPNTILQRGFTLVTSLVGKPITSQAEARQQSSLNITFKDGTLPIDIAIKNDSIDH